MASLHKMMMWWPIFANAWPLDARCAFRLCRADAIGWQRLCNKSYDCGSFLTGFGRCLAQVAACVCLGIHGVSLLQCAIYRNGSNDS